ncbi:MAG: hypothetical protein ACREP7_06315 [Lysobacter sp.]
MTKPVSTAKPGLHFLWWAASYPVLIVLAWAALALVNRFGNVGMMYLLAFAGGALGILIAVAILIGAIVDGIVAKKLLINLAALLGGVLIAVMLTDALWYVA